MEELTLKPIDTSTGNYRSDPLMRPTIQKDQALLRMATEDAETFINEFGKSTGQSPLDLRYLVIRLPDNGIELNIPFPHNPFGKSTPDELKAWLRDQLYSKNAYLKAQGLTSGREGVPLNIAHNVSFKVERPRGYDFERGRPAEFFYEWPSGSKDFERNADGSIKYNFNHLEGVLGIKVTEALAVIPTELWNASGTNGLIARHNKRIQDEYSRADRQPENNLFPGMRIIGFEDPPKFKELQGLLGASVFKVTYKGKDYKIDSFGDWMAIMQAMTAQGGPVHGQTLTIHFYRIDQDKNSPEKLDIVIPKEGDR